MLRKLSIIPFIVSSFFLYKGYDKMTNYKNPSDSSPFSDDRINAYVGGDAYNYIINGNYAISFFVVALFFLLIGLAMIFLREIRLKNSVGDDNKSKSTHLPLNEEKSIS